MRSSLVLAFLFVLTGAPAVSPLKADADVDVEITFDHFHERLAPHGVWIEVEQHGWCWYPETIDHEWRPYSHGHWVHSHAHGWCWVSDYDWGWACFHYGRWHHTDERWVWVPGYEWSGAWVAWRHGGAHIGWAALPPDAVWEVGVGIRTTSFSFEADIYEPSWVFVAEARFTSPSLRTVVISPGRNTIIIEKTKVLGGVKVKDAKPVNNVLEVDVVEKAVGKPVKSVEIRATKTLGAARVKGGDDEVRMFKPKVNKGAKSSPKDVDPSEGRRKTMEERQQAEKDEMNGRHERERNGKPDDPGVKERHDNERKDMDDRHKRERDDMNGAHKRDDPGKDRDDPGKGKDDPGKGRDDPGKGKDNPGGGKGKGKK